MKKKIRVGFIGLGLMGNPMAKNILKKGFALSVYNRTKTKTNEFRKLGANVFNSPHELAKTSDVVISMITGPNDVKEVMLGKDGVAKGSHKNLVTIDMSTIGPTAAIEISQGLKKYKIDFLDAPVTGSTNRAKTGELSIFVGGDEKVFKKIKPVLLAMGKDIHYMGITGNGQIIKLINNSIVSETLTSLAEGFLLADALGLSRQKMADALQNVFGVSPSMKTKIPHMVENKHPVAFSLANMRKDLGLATNELQKSGRKISLPLLREVERLYKKGVEMKLGNQDVSAILQVLSKEF